MVNCYPSIPPVYWRSHMLCIATERGRERSSLVLCPSCKCISAVIVMLPLRFNVGLLKPLFYICLKFHLVGGTSFSTTWVLIISTGSFIKKGKKHEPMFSGRLYKTYCWQTLNHFQRFHPVKTPQLHPDSDLLLELYRYLLISSNISTAALNDLQ